MEIHRFETFWLAVSLVFILGLVTTVVYGALGPGVAMVDASGGTIEDVSDPVASENFREPGVYRTGEDEYAVYVIARRFFFQPGTQEAIRLPADSRVTFYVTSPDVLHGFGVAGTNLNVMVIPGQVSEVTVEFDEPATYGIVCNEYCGSGHHTMEGRIEVVPGSAFNETAVGE